MSTIKDRECKRRGFEDPVDEPEDNNCVVLHRAASVTRICSRPSWEKKLSGYVWIRSYPEARYWRLDCTAVILEVHVQLHIIHFRDGTLLAS